MSNRRRAAVYKPREAGHSPRERQFLEVFPGADKKIAYKCSKYWCCQHGGA